jgi:hypothetical protein
MVTETFELKTLLLIANYMPQNFFLGQSESANAFFVLDFQIKPKPIKGRCI